MSEYTISSLRQEAMLKPRALDSHTSRSAMRRAAPGKCGSGSSTISSETRRPSPGAGRGDGDRARPLEGARPAAGVGLVHQPLADVVVEGVRRGGIRAQHRGLVALVQADRVRAHGALGEVSFHFPAFLGRELPVHIGVEERLLELAAFVRQARLLNSSTSTASSSSTTAPSSSACLPCSTPEATAYSSRFFCSSLRPR